jgi:hypothetical protein
MLPLASSVELATGTFLLLTLVGGVAFGVVLERAGFGSGCKLTAVFYGYDMSVVKVMFTAIVTAMVGLWLLASIGVIDMQEIYIVPTNYAAQLVGGLVFGAGFVIGGYCPGTAVVACAAGRTDAWVFALGLLAGIAVYARYMSGVEQWIRERDRRRHAALAHRHRDRLVGRAVRRPAGAGGMGHGHRRAGVRATEARALRARAHDQTCALRTRAGSGRADRAESKGVER